MAHENVLHLLDRVAAIRNRCDLDVFVYLSRHADALLTGEDIAAAVGYDLKKVAGSLDSFVFAGLLQRKWSRTDGPGMYVFAVGRPADGPLASLLELASSRPGRIQILHALESRMRPGERAPSSDLDRDEPPARDQRKG